MTTIDPITLALARMTPSPDLVAELVEYFARQEADCACLGHVLATYLVEVLFATVDLHAVECHNQRCHTCAGIATALLGVVAHTHLLNSTLAREETHP